LKTETTDFKIVVTTLFGLEEILAAEIRGIGGRDVLVLNRAVQCTGDIGFIYKCNFLLRTAIRVLRPLKSIKFRDDESYYKALNKIDWPSIFEADKSFSFHISGESVMFRNTHYAALKAKDAVVDRFREDVGTRPNIELEKPEISIAIHLNQHQGEVYLDSSGDSLHRRGYRDSAGLAPLSEVLAAGIVQLTGWNGGKTFFDPMCGSGTFLVEAAMLASKLPAGVFRNDFCFSHWKDYDAELFALIREGSINRAIEYSGKIMGRDNNLEALDAAKSNIAKAMLDDLISVQNGDFLSEDAPAETGILLMNPPYNKKIQSNNAELYRNIGTKLKHSYMGWEAYIITADIEAIKHIGLKPTWKKKLFNGPLEAILLKYELFEGKRKKHLDD